MKPVASTIKTIRYIKALLVATVGGFALLVVFGNATDCASRCQSVTHVLAMGARREALGKTMESRGIERECAWHPAYIGVIVVEAFIMVACVYAAYRMARTAALTDAEFFGPEKWGILGLTGGLFLWFFGFQAVGGEWFAMWMNDDWNGIPDAVRLCTYIGTVLIIVLIGGDRFDQAPAAKPESE